MKRSMWMVTAGVACAALGLAVSAALVLSQRKPERHDFAATWRDEWVARAKAHLADFSPSWRTHRLEAATQHGTGKTCYLMRCEGLIEFRDGGWVYVVCHNHHWEGRSAVHGEIPDVVIGNVVVARDHKGRSYVSHDPHGCPSLGFDPPDGREFASADEFFATPVTDVAPHPWVKLE